MKVRELVARSTFTAGAGRASAVPPRVTVILPTFRRGDSGLLGRTIDSLLTQSFDDFELIVVDDASTDSSAAVIAAAMARDPRVSVIRHDRNIGLPAVSEYEAYRLARGDLIAFAFDDTVFYPDGLRTLVAESDAHPGELIAGRVELFFRNPDGSVASTVLGAGATDADLLTRNVIPNSAVLAPTAILDVVGLYDPHISLARLCDYDLWLRVRRRFPIRFLEVTIGEEHGPAVADSLGATYPLDHWLADDRIRQDRDDQLSPERFGDIDVFDLDAFESMRSRTVVEYLVDRHLETRDWMTRPGSATTPRRVPRIVVLVSAIDARILSAFEGSRDDPAVHVRILEPWWRTVGELAEADALIVTRPSADNSDWIAAARQLGIPVFCFLSGVETDVEQLRTDLAGCDGVIAGSAAIADELRAAGLPGEVTLPTGLAATVAPYVSAGEPDERIRLRQIAGWLARTRGAGNARATDPASAIAAAGQTQAAVRRSRRAHLLPSRAAGSYSDLLGDAGPRRGVRVELSHPLTGLPYLGYRMPIAPGTYQGLQLVTWADAGPGDLVGVEIIDPAGRILLTTVANLPRSAAPAVAVLKAHGLRVEQAGDFEVRVFAQTPRLAYVLERVDRGRLGIGRPRVTPLIRFVP